MKQFTGLTALALVAALAACGGGDSADSNADTPAPDAPAAETPAETPEPAAQAAPSIDPASLPEGVDVAVAQEGQEVFHGAGICYTCHAQGGGGGPLAPDLTDDTWLNADGTYESIIAVINEGVAAPKEHPGAMLPKAGMPLTDDQVSAVAAYVYSLSR